MKEDLLHEGVDRRRFLKMTGLATISIPFVQLTGIKTAPVALVMDPADTVTAAAPVQWASRELEQSLVAQGITVNRYTQLNETKAGEFVIAIAGGGAAMTNQLLKGSTIKAPAVPESLVLAPLKSGGKQVLLACGYDERGVIYALLELADRVWHSDQPLSSLNISKPVIEQPANEIRSLNRLFVSDVHDKPWYNDREMWPQYLTMLATQRFNRFNLSFGIGYDFLQRITDAYFLFAYPFLFSLPGYNVRVPQLPDAERDANLAMLQYISEQTVARGLRFQLGLWMHGHEWLNTTNANYTIEGINKDNHAIYCRDAVRHLLQVCPAIGGITFRIHGESGVNEGSYNFWKTIFDGVKTCGRVVEIDMHAKGMDDTMIEAAVSTGMPVVISPKYWAEHMGMPYHQADIRALEIPNEKRSATGLMAISAGSRSFTRYGYGDLMKEDRPYKVIHRIWPGTQRLLLWGDPVTSAAHAKAFSFCGSNGVEMMEALSFKGRRGSGIAGDRCGYADAAFKPRWDWEKYLYTLRIFGRSMYNPQTDNNVWQRYLKKQFNNGATAVEAALANVSRILPIVLTTHAPSAGNNNYWPELYTNQPITDVAVKYVYPDTPSPKTFGNVTPLDPQLFLSINDFVKEYLAGKRSGKYHPLEAAQWLEAYAAAGEQHLLMATTTSSGKNKPGWLRMATDVSMQIAIGRFFAAKFRASVLYAAYEQTGDSTALTASLKAYRAARGYWAAMADKARTVYVPDITVGEQSWLRGHWLDRLPAMDDDIANMEKKLSAANSNSNSTRVKQLIQEATGKPVRATVSCKHISPQKFTAGQPLGVEFVFDKAPSSAVLYYRHVNQAERYQQTALTWKGGHGSAHIPATYTNSPYPIAYYLEVRHAADEASLYPGFNANLASQPYFTVRKD
jgi:hypothetical protein